MAYIGGTVGQKPVYTTTIGTAIVALPNTQSNSLHFDTAYSSFVNINVDTTTNLVGTNNYYLVGEVNIADTKTWDVAGTGVLNVV